MGADALPAAELVPDEPREVVVVLGDVDELAGSAAGGICRPMPRSPAKLARGCTGAS